MTKVNTKAELRGDLARLEGLGDAERELHRDKTRRATKPRSASQERRVAAKKVARMHKKNRGRPKAGDK